MAKNDCSLTAEEARSFLEYIPSTGAFTRKIRAGRARAGSVPGAKDRLGYVQISLKNKLWMAHRLAWLIVHGQWPPSRIDHINGQRDDNRIDNLRLANASQNMWNRKAQAGTSKYKGVYLNRRTNKWGAGASAHGKHHHAGWFDCEEEANKAAKATRERLHTEFCRHE